MCISQVFHSGQGEESITLTWACVGQGAIPSSATHSLLSQGIKGGQVKRQAHSCLARRLWGLWVWQMLKVELCCLWALCRHCRGARQLARSGSSAGPLETTFQPLVCGGASPVAFLGGLIGKNLRSCASSPLIMDRSTWSQETLPHLGPWQTLALQAGPSPAKPGQGRDGDTPLSKGWAPVFPVSLPTSGCTFL